MFNQSSTSLTVSENSLAALIGIPAPRDPGFALSARTARVTVLLSNGTVLLADGVTSLILGQVITIAAAPVAVERLQRRQRLLRLSRRGLFPTKNYAVDVLFKAQLAA
jgi:hypothetical protein